MTFTILISLSGLHIGLHEVMYELLIKCKVDNQSTPEEIKFLAIEWLRISLKLNIRDLRYEGEKAARTATAVNAGCLNFT